MGDPTTTPDIETETPTTADHGSDDQPHAVHPDQGEADTDEDDAEQDAEEA